MIEKLLIWIAWRLPKPLAMWVFVRVAVNASFEMPDREMPGITCVEALNEWK